MSDISVQIDIQTGGAKKNLDELLGSLNQVKNAVSATSAKSSGNRGISKDLEEEAKRIKQINEGIRSNTARFATDFKQIWKDMKADAVSGKLSVKDFISFDATIKEMEADKARMRDITDQIRTDRRKFASDIKSINEGITKQFASSFTDLKKVALASGDSSSYKFFAQAEAAAKQFAGASKTVQSQITADMKAAERQRIKDLDDAVKQRAAVRKKEEADTIRLARANTAGGVLSAYSGAQRTSQASNIAVAAQKATGYSGSGYADLSKHLASLSSGQVSALNSELGKLNKTGEGFKNTLAEIAKATQLVDGPLGGVAYRIDLLGSILSSTGAKMVGTIALVAGLGTTLVKLGVQANAMRSVSGFLQNVTQSTSEYQTAVAGVLAVSKSQYTDIETTAKFYGRLANATQDAGIAQKDLIKVTETLAAGFRLNMTSAGEASSVMMQFTQALGSGRLQGDEFRSMAENASVVMTKLAKAILGPSGTISGLRAMSSEGKLTTDIIVPAMAAINAEVTAAAAKMPVTLGQAMTSLSNSFSEVAFNSQGLVSAIDFLSGSIVAFSNALPTVIDYGLKLGIAFGTWKILTTIGPSLIAVINGVVSSAAALALGAKGMSTGLEVASVQATIATGAFSRLGMALKTIWPAALIFGALELIDALKSSGDAADEASKAMDSYRASSQKQIESLNSLTKSLDPWNAALGANTAATIDWKTASVEQISQVLSKDEYLTSQTVANVQTRISAILQEMKVKGSAADYDLEKYGAKKAQLEREIADAKNVSTPLYDGGTGGAVQSAYIENLSKQLTEVTAKYSDAQLATSEHTIALAKAAFAAANLESGYKRTSETLKSYSSETSKAKGAAEAAAKGGERQLYIYRQVSAELEKNKQSRDLFSPEELKAKEEHYGKIFDYEKKTTDLISAANKAQKSRTSELDKQAKLQEKSALFVATEVQELDNQLSQLRLMNELTEKNGGNIEEATIQYEIQKTQNELDLRIKKDKLLVDEDALQVAHDTIATKVRQIEAEKKIAEATKQNTEAAIRLGDSLESSISDGIFAGFTKGMDGFFSNLKNSFLRGISDSIAGSLRGGLQGQLGGLFGVPNAAGVGASSSPLGGLSSLSGLSSIASTLASGSLLSNSMVGTLNDFGFNQLGGAAPWSGSGLGTQLSSTFSVGNVAGGFAGNYLGGKVFGDSKYGSLGGAAGGLIGQAVIPIPILGAAIGSFLGNGLGSMLGPGKPNPASIFSYSDANGATYGSKHMDTKFAEGSLGAILNMRTSLASVTGRSFSQFDYLTGGADKGQGVFALGDYRTSADKITFNANDEKAADAALGKFAALMASKLEGVTPEILNALNIVQESAVDSATALNEVAFALNFDKLGEVKEPISEMEAALKALNDTFDNAVATAKKLELSEAKVEEMRRKAITTLQNEYNKAVQNDITSALNPQYGAQQAEKLRYEAQLKDAKTVGGNTSAVELLHQINLMRINAQYADKSQLENSQKQLDLAQQAVDIWKNLPSSLAASIGQLKLSDLSTLSPAEKMAEAQRQFDAIAASARNKDPEAMAQLAEAGNTLLQLRKEYFGSTTAYGGTFDAVVSELENAKSIAELQYDASQGSYDELKKQTSLLEKMAATGSNGGLANANQTLISLYGKLSPDLFSKAESVIAAATPGVVAGGGRRTAALNANSEANTAAVMALRALGIPGFASGGRVTGGFAGFDSVPALLMPGERVLNTAQSKNFDQGTSTQISELRALRMQMAQMQAFIAELVQLTSEGNSTRNRQATKMKASAYGG